MLKKLVIAISAIVATVVALHLALDAADSAPHQDCRSGATGPHWRAGDSAVYDLSLEIGVETRLDRSGGPTLSDYRMSGQLAMRVLDTDDHGVSVGFELLSPRVAVRAEPRPDIAARLATAFVVTFDREGRQVAAHLPARLPGAEEHTLVELMRTYQVIRPEGAPGDCWTVEEEDSTGTARVRYAWDPVEGSISKEKLAYSRMRSEAEGGPSLFPDPRVHVASSEGRFRIDASRSWLSAATVAEDLLIESSRGQSIRVRAAASLAIAESFETGSIQLFAADLDLAGLLGRLAAEPVADPERRLAEVVPATGEEMRRLEIAVAKLNESKGRGFEAFHEILAMLLAHPDLASRFPWFLQDPTLDSHAAANLVHLLERAGTEEAQVALGTMVDDLVFGRTLRVQSAVALGGLEHPGERAMRSLWQAASPLSATTDPDVANCATLALGRAACSVKETDPVRYAALRDRLLEELANTSDDAQRATFCRALGNTRDADLVPDLDECLSSDTPMMRFAAARSLASMPTEESRTALESALLEEQIPAVRLAIASSLGEFPVLPVSTTARLRELVGSESDDRVRCELVRCLGRDQNMSPDTRGWLMTLVKGDSSPRVRRQAARALARSRAASPAQER